MSLQFFSKTGKPGKLGYSHRRHIRERFIETILFMMAFTSVAITFSIVVMLVKESIVFFQQVPLWDFYLMTRIMAYSH
jgi:phosphate transport system permease protein